MCVALVWPPNQQKQDIPYPKDLTLDWDKFPTVMNSKEVRHAKKSNE